MGKVRKPHAESAHGRVGDRRKRAADRVEASGRGQPIAPPNAQGHPRPANGNHNHNAAERSAQGRTLRPEGETAREIDEVNQELFRRYRRGESVDSLAKRFGLSKTGVHHLVNKLRFQRIAQWPLEFIPSEEFDRVRSGAEEAVIAGPTPEIPKPAKKTRPPAGLPPYLASLYEVPLLTREQEVHLFRKMNYLKYKARKLRDGLDPRHPSATVMDEIERRYHDCVAAKNELIRANLRLVVSIAKRYSGGPESLFELISDGNISLIRAVEKFDYSRGFKFSTYASWAIMKNFARTIPEELRRYSRFRPQAEELLSAAKDERSNQILLEALQSQREEQVAKILEHLDERERQIIRYRFGLEGRREPMTLKEVGAAMGVTKERVRQLESRALSKLRKAAEEEKVEAPGNGHSA